jgi:hypothetical protein
MNRLAQRLAAALLTVVTFSLPAVALDAHGPDTWQVVDIAPDDVLNVRMGPGTEYPIIASFAHNARGLVLETCVPLISLEQLAEMSAGEHAALPPRWCLMRATDRQTRDWGVPTRGWVAARYLAEDGGTPTATPSADGGKPAAPPVTDRIHAAEALVRELYSAHAMSLRGSGKSPLRSPRALDFFSDNVVAQIDPAVVGADPLYDAQDTDISNLRIAADRTQPTFRGMITIHADFLNFGHPRRVSFYLRPDTERAGNSLRIFRVEHEDWEIW